MAPLVIPSDAMFAATLRWMIVPLTIWCTLASLELIAVRRAFLPGQALGSDITALVRGRLTPALVDARVLPVVAAVRLAAGLALPVSGAALPAALIVILGCSVVLAITCQGGDGADKIALVATLAALLIVLGLRLDDRLLCFAGLAWAAGQATIAYATSGMAKLARGFWRTGDALAAAMTSYRSGHRHAALVVRHRPAALALAWGIMLVEAAFPLALFAPPPLCLALLATLGLFHVATALVMGLNTYPWAFIATYPCVMAANAIIAGP